jgi:hypothetical protein
MAAISIFLGIMTVIQFFTSMFTGSSMRARAQQSYNDWYRVAEIADEIGKDPQKAAQLIKGVNGIADAARNEIKAYSREKLDFVPWFDPASHGGPNPAPPLGFWKTVRLAFSPK